MRRLRAVVVILTVPAPILLGVGSLDPLGEVPAGNVRRRASEFDLGPALGAADGSDRLPTIETAEDAALVLGPERMLTPTVAVICVSLRWPSGADSRPKITADGEQSSGGSHLDHGSAHGRLQGERSSGIT